MRGRIFGGAEEDAAAGASGLAARGAAFWTGPRRAASAVLLSLLVSRRRLCARRLSPQGVSGARGPRGFHVPLALFGPRASRGPIDLVAPLLFLLVALFAARADAALSVSPVTVEMTARTGDTGAGTWQVGNTGSEPVDVAVSAIRYRDYLGGNYEAPAPDWIRIAPDSAHLAPGERIPIGWSFQVPADLTGEDLVMVFFSERPRGGGIQGRIGAAFYLAASGTLTPALASLSTRASRDPQGQVRFHMELRNGGNVHLRPRGEFVVRDSAGVTIARAPLEIGLPVLPRSREMFTSRPVQPRLGPGDYTVHWSIGTGDVDGRPGPELNGEFPLRQE